MWWLKLGLLAALAGAVWLAWEEHVNKIERAVVAEYEAAEAKQAKLQAQRDAELENIGREVAEKSAVRAEKRARAARAALATASLARREEMERLAAASADVRDWRDAPVPDPVVERLREHARAAFGFDEAGRSVVSAGIPANPLGSNASGAHQR